VGGRLPSQQTLNGARHNSATGGSAFVGGLEGRRVLTSIAGLSRKVAGADRTRVAAETIVAVRDEEDGVPLGVVIEARVRLGLPGDHREDAEQAWLLGADQADPELRDPAGLSGDRIANGIYQKRFERPILRLDRAVRVKVNEVRVITTYNQHAGSLSALLIGRREPDDRESNGACRCVVFIDELVAREQ
jgi:hypothetical protein